MIVWDVPARSKRHVLSGHRGPLWWVTYSRNGKRLASGGYATDVRIWDPRKGKIIKIIKGSGTNGGADFSPDDHMLALPDGSKVELVNLKEKSEYRFPDKLLDLYQKEAGLKLEGFSLRERLSD